MKGLQLHKFSRLTKRNNNGYHNNWLQGERNYLRIRDVRTMGPDPGWLPRTVTSRPSHRTPGSISFHRMPLNEIDLTNRENCRGEAGILTYVLSAEFFCKSKAVLKKLIN